MKTLASASLRVSEEFGFVRDATFRGFQPGDATSTDVIDAAAAGLIRGHTIAAGAQTVLYFRWERTDPDTGNSGFEMLTIGLDEIRPGAIELEKARVCYTLGTRQRMEGAYPERLTGTLIVERMWEDEVEVTIALEAFVIRWHEPEDRPTRPEQVRGTFRLHARGLDRLTPWQRGEAATRESMTSAARR